MVFYIAFLAFSAGTAWLFHLDRDKSAVNSKALWLPVIWIWIIGSRPVSSWFAIWLGFGQIGPGQALDAQLDGSPTDAYVFLMLLTAAIGVLIHRKRQALLVTANSVLTTYLFYCLVSCAWSPFPDVALKRWIKTIGDLAMVLVIVTDPEPIQALRKVFSRVGFILMPASILLIRYSLVGRAYDPGGTPMFTGVTTNKNTLGLITFVVSLGALWNCIHWYRAKRGAERGRKLTSQVILLAFGIAVLEQAHSATSIACFIVGAGLMLATYLPAIRKRPKRVYALTLTILVACGVGMALGGGSAAVQALGRDPTTLGDRTLIWDAVIPACPNALIGAGFESFWNGYGKYATGKLSKYERGLNSAHNGYIETYLNLGFVGLGLLALLIISAYRRASAAFLRNPEVGSLMLAFVATVVIYSVTEAGYRIMTPTWISFLLVLAGSQRLALSKSREPIKARPQRSELKYQVADQT